MRNNNNNEPVAGCRAANTVEPLAYWRTFGRPEYDTVRRILLSCEVGGILASDALWRRAITGDAASSIAIALTMRIPQTVTMPVDVRMSILLNAALTGDPACALVMGNMLSRMPLGAGHRERLTRSWVKCETEFPLVPAWDARPEDMP
ncbi:hypothetical protein [Tardiphaga sp.]|jgi:hypothetical protein|uniref:hypothetical protein n=1 Tax=Tardiphaga sp. TaxID=1926292 RepID=UPI0037D9A84C